MMEPYLTIHQLAKKKTIPFGIHRLYALADSGQIPSYRLGGKTVVLESEVHAAVRKLDRKLTVMQHLSKERTNGESNVGQGQEAVEDRLPRPQRQTSPHLRKG